MIVDLSVRVGAETRGPPAAGSPPVVMETSFRGPGHWQSTRISSLIHTGSHVDAPLHVVEGGASIGELSLERVCGEAVVVDLTAIPERGAIGRLELERSAGAVRPGDIVALRTDWSDRMWGAFPDYYTRSPYLTQEGAAWLGGREPKAVVFDFFEEECAISPEFTSDDFVAHLELLGRGIPLIEQATGLGRMGIERFTLFAPFVLLDGVEAAPCRIFGMTQAAASSAGPA